LADFERKIMIGSYISKSSNIVISTTDVPTEN
jgi:hypothetical protein